MKKFAAILLTLATMLVVGYGSKLHAATTVYDTKSAPGTMCHLQEWDAYPQPATPPVGTIQNARIIRNLGTVHVTSSSPAMPGTSPASPNIQLECPIVRDNSKNTNGVSVFVWVYDGSTTSAVTCWLVSLAPHNMNPIQTLTQQSSVAGTGDWVMSFTATTSVADGYYAVRCGLDWNDKVYGYEWSEFGGDANSL